MNVPLGRVTRLWYKDTQPKLTTDASVLVVEFRAPNAEIYEHELDNRHWLVDNPALQLMALHDFKPSDIEGTSMDVEDWRWTLPLTYVDNSGPFESTEGGQYKLSQMALKGGEAALREATWFDADDGEKLDSGASAASEGGGDSDGGGGAETAEDSADDTAVTVEIADEEDDVGVRFDASSS
jgi:hypothetical protein